MTRIESIDVERSQLVLDTLGRKSFTIIGHKRLKPKCLACGGTAGLTECTLRVDGMNMNLHNVPLCVSCSLKTKDASKKGD